MNEPSRSHPTPKRRGTIIAILTALIFGIGLAAWQIAGDRSTPEDGSGSVPPSSHAQGKEWNAVLHTSEGDLEISLDGAAAPQAVASFIFLADEGFYDGTECHRLLPSALVQCGDPTGTGAGGPGYSFGPIENAPTDDLYRAGTVAMARVGGDGESMGSQFFLVFEDIRLPSDAAGGYSVMGSISSGLELLQKIGQAGTVDGSMDGRPLTRVIIESVEVK